MLNIGSDVPADTRLPRKAEKIRHKAAGYLTYISL
jgi:hypothetical protein